MFCKKSVISKNSQENICARVSFLIKLQAFYHIETSPWKTSPFFVQRLIYVILCWWPPFYNSLISFSITHLCIFDICTRWAFLTRCRIEIKRILHLFTIGKISWCLVKTSMREKCPYSEFFWSVFSLTAGKYGPEKLRIWTLITQCVSFVAEMRNYSCQWCYWDFLNKTFTNGWTWKGFIWLTWFNSWLLERSVTPSVAAVVWNDFHVSISRFFP